MEDKQENLYLFVNIDKPRNLSYESFGLVLLTQARKYTQTRHTVYTHTDNNVVQTVQRCWVPIFPAGMCTPGRILLHVCVGISVIFVALLCWRWKSGTVSGRGKGLSFRLWRERRPVGGVV